jgi:hypothetical protein
MAAIRIEQLSERYGATLALDGLIGVHFLTRTA